MFCVQSKTLLDQCCAVIVLFTAKHLNELVQKTSGKTNRPTATSQTHKISKTSIGTQTLPVQRSYKRDGSSVILTLTDRTEGAALKQSRSWLRLGLGRLRGGKRPGGQLLPL